jgi:hypothetical protein
MVRIFLTGQPLSQRYTADYTSAIPLRLSSPPIPAAAQAGTQPHHNKADIKALYQRLLPRFQNTSGDSSLTTTKMLEENYKAWQNDIASIQSDLTKAIRTKPIRFSSCYKRNPALDQYQGIMTKFIRKAFLAKWATDPILQATLHSFFHTKCQITINKVKVNDIEPITKYFPLQQKPHTKLKLPLSSI